MKAITKYEFIECIIPTSTTATRFTFADQPQLRFVSLQGLECYNVVTITNSILSNNPVISAANMLRVF